MTAITELRTKSNLNAADTLHGSLQTLPVSGTAQMPVGPHDHVLITFRIENSSNVRLANSATADVQIVHWTGSGADAVISEQSVTGYALRQPMAVLIPPGDTFWVGTSALTGAPGTADHMDIHYTFIRKPS
jgi:hypothetical protein